MLINVNMRKNWHFNIYKYDKYNILEPKNQKKSIF